MNGLRRRLTFANVLSVIAVFIALGGVGYAVSTINGRHIRKNSIPANRLTKAARASLQGSQGPPGGPGPRGDEGPTGPTGPSNAYYANAGSGTPTVSVPAGAYSVAGAGTVFLPASAIAVCEIEVNGGPIPPSLGTFSVNSANAPPGSAQTVSVPDSAILHLPSPATISNHCALSAGSQADASVTAIKVGSATP